MRNSNNIFTDKINFRTIDTYRISYLVIFVISFLLTEIGRYIYRPFIYANNLKDSGLADSMGNSGGIIVQIFFALAIINSPKNKGLRLIAFFTVGYIIYEIIQPILPRGTFDWLDIYGTLIGGALGLLIFLTVHLLVKENRIIHRF